jgi:ABC-type phosphate transport system substrate-binding protein
MVNIVKRVSRSMGEVDSKMPRRATIAAVVMAALLFVAGHSSNAQGLKQELLKGIVKSMGPDAVQAMMVQVASEVAKNPELRKQLLQALGPETTKAIIASATGQAAGGIPIPTAEPVSRGPVKGVQSQPAAVNPSTPAVQSLQVSKATQTESAEATKSSSTQINLGPLAIVVNPANPVSQLTVDELRKLASGEYTNWSQVGGPDRPVKVVTVRCGRASAESLLNIALASTTAALPFNSFIIPAVDQNEGAIGLIPTTTLEQVDFIGKHDAIKVIGIRRDNTQSPAVAPSRMAVFTGSYPMM